MRTRTKAPYVYDKGSHFVVNIRVGGRLVFVGRVKKWINGVILFNDTLHSLGRDLREFGPYLSKTSVLQKLTQTQKNSVEMTEWLEKQELDT